MLPASDILKNDFAIANAALRLVLQVRVAQASGLAADQQKVDEAKKTLLRLGDVQAERLDDFIAGLLNDSHEKMKDEIKFALLVAAVKQSHLPGVGRNDLIDSSFEFIEGKNYDNLHNLTRASIKTFEAGRRSFWTNMCRSFRANNRINPSVPSPMSKLVAGLEQLPSAPEQADTYQPVAQAS